MCIIVAKEKGVEMPDRHILKNCFDYNSDGAGIMWNYNNKVHIHKGFMKWEDFDNFLDALSKQIDLKNSGICTHFRIRTHGKTSSANCHPFPISNKIKDLKLLKLTTDKGVMHNGIIPIKPIHSLSDTQTYIIKRLYNIQKTHPRFLESNRVMSQIEKEIGSKMAFLTSEGKIHTIGDFIEQDGVMYSNRSFEDKCYYGYRWLQDYDYWCGSSEKNDAEYEYISNLKMIANCLGHREDIVDVLLENGFTLQEIEDYIYEF
ncbi:MAG: hypothetical protein E7418_01845 [Ruminococcaceae bacterium]|nr:hypothetical protein [Oscillospiraceae bacterium]